MSNITSIIIYLCLASGLLQTASAAPLAKVEFTFELRSSQSPGNILSHLNCQLLQTLDWNNFANSWVCKNSRGQSLALTNTAVTIGYNYDLNVSYAEYVIPGANSFGTILNKLLFSDKNRILDSSPLKILFIKGKPAVSQEILLVTKQGPYILKSTQSRYL